MNKISIILKSEKKILLHTKISQETYKDFSLDKKNNMIIYSF